MYVGQIFGKHELELLRLDKMLDKVLFVIIELLSLKRLSEQCIHLQHILENQSEYYCIWYIKTGQSRVATTRAMNESEC